MKRSLGAELILADKHFRASDWHNARRIYVYCSHASDIKQVREIARNGVKLCDIKLKNQSHMHQEANNTASAKSSIKELACDLNCLELQPQDILMFLRSTVSERACLQLSYKGEVTDGKSVNNSVVFSYFLQSPWQISLAFLASLVVKTYSLDIEAQKIAIDSYSQSKLTLAFIISSFYSPIIASLLGEMLTRDDNLNLNQEALNFFYEKLPSTDILRSLNDLESLLRDASLKTSKYLLSEKIIVQKVFNRNFSIAAGSIFLNESLFVTRCLFNHYSLIDRWVLVEGACQGYPIRKVSGDGLSLDYSWLKLNLFPDPEQKLTYKAHGWTIESGEQAKCELRNDYISCISEDYLVVIDIDEFYTGTSFEIAVNKLKEGASGVIIPQMHLWKNLDTFITGGYYNITHMRFFEMSPGLRYVSNHNFPELPNEVRIDSISAYKYERCFTANHGYFKWEEPFCFHLGFCKDPDDMKDKTDYYLARGEEETRPITTQSRAAWFLEDIPEECKLLKHNNLLPKGL